MKKMLLVCLLGGTQVLCVKDSEPNRALEERGKSQLYNQVTSPLGIACAATFGTFILYKSSKTIQGFVNNAATAAKSKFVDTVGLPLYRHYDRIKEKGISNWDVVACVLFLVSCYGVKKVADHFKLWSSVQKWDSTDIKGVIKEDWAHVKKNKLSYGVGLSTVALCALILKNDASRSRIERFLWSLTHRQKKAISDSPKLSEKLQKASSDPRILHNDEHLHALLEDDQRELLRRAIEEYRINNDPFSLLDEDEESTF